MGHKILYLFQQYVIDLILQTKKLVDPTIEHQNYCTAPSPRPEYISYGLMYHPDHTPTYDIRSGTNRETLSWTTEAKAIFLNFMNASPYRSVWVDTNCDGTKDALLANSELTLSRTLHVTETKTLLVCIFADNQFKLRIDGELVVQALTGDTNNFKYLHLFPVTLDAGQHLFTFSGIGDGSVNDSLGAIIWDNTWAEIKTPLPKANWNVLYSSDESIAEGVDIVTCPIDYSYDNLLEKCVNISDILNIVTNDYAIITPILNDISPANISSWTLDFGDTNSTSGTGIPPNDFEHQYASLGTYQIKFIVIMNSGLPVQCTAQVILD